MSRDTSPPPGDSSAQVPAPVPARVEVPADVVFREVAGETVILDLESQRYFSLDPVGTRMWVLLAELGSLPAVRERLLAEFDVEPRRLSADLDDLVSHLLAEGLLRPAG